MLTTIRKMCNSQGIVIPEALMQRLGLRDRVELRVEDDALVIRRTKDAPRAGWAESSRLLAEADDDRLIMPDFVNEQDENVEW